MRVAEGSPCLPEHAAPGRQLQRAAPAAPGKMEGNVFAKCSQEKNEAAPVSRNPGELCLGPREHPGVLGDVGGGSLGSPGQVAVSLQVPQVDGAPRARRILRCSGSFGCGQHLLEDVDGHVDSSVQRVEGGRL